MRKDSNNRLFALMLLLFLSSLAAQSLAQSQAERFNDARYATYRTWALAPPWAENGYKIVSFIPESYLLFLSDDDPIYVSGQEYRLALTQDGAEVLVFSEAISELSFQRSVGDHQVIFNADYLLCKTVGCSPALERDWLVARGEAFRITSSSQSLITLRGTRAGQVVEGYVTPSELDRLARVGKVTRADLPQPRYQIDKYLVPTLSTTCGQRREVGEQILLSEEDMVTRDLIELIPIAQASTEGVEEEPESENEEAEQLSGTEITITSGFGGEGYANAFYLYRIRNFETVFDSEEGYFEVATALKIDCTSYEDGSYTENFIQHMTLVNSKNFFNGRPIANEIPIDYFDTPRDLLDYTGDAYMVSINKPDHFEDALEILTSRIGDRQLSGFLLTELNRSCRSSMRNPYSESPCVSYDY